MHIKCNNKKLKQKIKQKYALGFVNESGKKKKRTTRCEFVSKFVEIACHVERGRGSRKTLRGTTVKRPV